MIVVNTGLAFDDATSQLSERNILAGSQMLIDGAADHAFTRNDALAALEHLAGYGKSLLADDDFPKYLEDWRKEIASRPENVPPVVRGKF